jgi:hypothetical protein
MRDNAIAVIRRLLRLPVLVLAVIVVLVDDGFRAFVIPAVRALSRLRMVQRLEAAVAGLPAYALLTLFLVPLAIIEPLKVYGLLLFGEGRILSGILVFAVAKVVGLGLAERLFAIGRDKLLSIGWFATGHRWVLATRDVVHGWLSQKAAWRQAVRLARRIRAGLSGLRIRIASVFAGRNRRGGLIGAARRQLFAWRAPDRLRMGRTRSPAPISGRNPAPLD